MTEELAEMLRKIIALEAATPEETKLLNAAYDGVKSALKALSTYEEIHQSE